MKKISYIIGIAALFLVASCNSDEMPQSNSEVKKTYFPVVKANFGEFSESTTKAGVVEENSNPAVNGEKFYWSNGDRALLLFYQQGDVSGRAYKEIVYQAEGIGENDKQSWSDFSPAPGQDGLEPGTYTVYGLYPAPDPAQAPSGWEWRDDRGPDGAYTATMRAPVVGGEPTITVSEESSSYLGLNIFMKTGGTTVVVDEDGDISSGSIDLQYQQLGGVLRIHLRNEIHTAYPLLTRFRFGKTSASVPPATDPTIPFFNTQGYLASIDDVALTPVPAFQVGAVSIVPEAGSTEEFDFFIPILPTDPFVDDEVLTLWGDYENSEGDPMLPSYGRVFPSTKATLQTGFQAGKSYYFNLTGWE